ncbi:hypothetical protein PAXINDRAFT_17388 [Paxillus involutus ATCC 200175]|uniref:Protein kinase domain-containing protein n=1 Tax=Paxillus involutus ATCC 200175 TaxID=664439 RepID=A0A0C9T1C4_PAXIN|nr:hypothetical protein PAXINDRAFT_17388 [Paxillus involutus ATCC 200175]
MDHQTWLREAADLPSVSWLLNPPSGHTAPQSDTFVNAAFSLVTPPGSYQTLLPPRSHDNQSTYEGIFPETNSSAKASSGTTFLDHPPQNFVRQHGDDSESSGDGSSSLRTGPEVSYPIRIQEGSPASHGRLSASVPMRGPYSPSEDMPNPGETVLCDDLNFVTLHPDGLGRDHVCRVSFVYWVLQRSLAWHGCESCPKARELWLQMIEGNDDVDEIWLWVDGDEEWIRQNHDASVLWSYSKLEEEDWVAAQSALRRRIERTQLTPCPVPKTTADLTLERRAHLQGATRAQRFAAIDWLIRTSRRKEDPDFQIGWSSQSKFGLGNLINWWFHDKPNFRSIARFPEQPEAYKEFEEKRKAMGCKCLDRGYSTRKSVPEWVGMMRLLRPEWNLDVECIYTYNCDACKSRAAEIYDRLYGDDHSRDIPLLPIQLAFSLVVVDNFYEYMDYSGAPMPFFKAVATKSLSPNAQREADHRFWPLYSPGERDTSHSPWVNAYPKVMQQSLVAQSCEVGPYSRLHSLPHVEAESQGEYLDELPVGFADDAPNLITLIGAVVWISACRLLDRAEAWHWVWEDFFKFKDILPLPELAGTQLELRNHLQRLWLEDSSCFRHVDHIYEDDDYNFLTIYAAIIIYVKSLNLGPKFEGCPKCHAVYLTVVTGSGSGAETSLAQGSNDRQLPDPTASQKHFGGIPDLTEYLQRLHIDPVAAGGYGIVYKCSLRRANDHSSEVAIKSFRHELTQNISSLPEQEFSKTLRREIKLWHGLRHSNIVPLLGIAYGFGSAISTVSPWISGGPLHTYLDTRDAYLNLFDRFNLLEGVATGLRYFHGDLTSGNVLIDNDGKARLSDFGLSAVLGGLNGGSSFALTTCRPGAIEWAAPELVLTPDSVQPCPASDIFSFGCIMLQILSGQPPWGKMNRNKIILSLDKGERAPRPAHRPIRDGDWDFIRRCWSSADVRPSIEDVVDYISPVLASLREDHGLAAGASLQSYERPATRKRTYLEVVLDNDSTSRRGALGDHPHWQVDDEDDSRPSKYPRFALL